jgi:hypothetical protein
MKLSLKAIKFYQKRISPFLGSNCRFYPSCSEYCYLAIEKYGTIKGILKGFKRILKCHPWNKGGVDLP